MSRNALEQRTQQHARLVHEVLPIMRASQTNGEYAPLDAVLKVAQAMHGEIHEMEREKLRGLRRILYNMFN